MANQYMVAKGDLCLQSKHADAAFSGYEGLALFFFDEPKRGKCLSVQYNKGDWPAVHVIIQANWKARLQIAKYRKEGSTWTEGSF